MSVTKVTYRSDTAAGDDANIGYTAAEGLILTGQGSTNDVTIKNDADADVIKIATGATNVDIVGDVTAATLNADGDTSAGDNAALGYTSVLGAILTGQGSTNDVTLVNDADATVLGIPTGTTNVKIEGNVGVGIAPGSAPITASADFEGHVLRLYNDGNDANRDGILIQGGADNGSGTTTYILANDGDGTSTGELQTSSGTFQVADTSDRRIKQDIVDTSIDGTNAIKDMRVVDFAYKKNPTHTIVGGFIGQELQEVFAPAVTGEETELDDGTPDKVLSVSRERLVPVLVKALQEAITKIETLETKVTALENA